MENKDRKIVFFDIDGTLVDGPTHQIPQSAVEAIRKLRENGHLAFINTGRTLVSIEPRIREIGFDGLVCGCGTLFIMKEKRCLATAFCMKNVRKSYMSCADSVSRHFLKRRSMCIMTAAV